MARNPARSARRAEKIASDIRVELRSILRQLEDLCRPIARFERLSNPEVGQPEWYVHFDDRPRRRIHGMRFRSGSVELPDERITDAVLSLAESVWHLKDRLRQWTKARCLPDSVENHAKLSPELLICADLANWKKHGRHKDRSGQNPRLGLVRFDTSRSGAIEFFWQGATKDKELLVTDRVPLSFTVPVEAGEDGGELGDAVTLLAKAMDHWKPLIDQLGVLDDGDRESAAMRELMGL
ncbi:MAG: hypothetical protein GWP05_11190 [Anaerolineaceae bacterium]|nr:hypothetical protein [Anaerolineaceae bacterium]